RTDDDGVACAGGEGERRGEVRGEVTAGAAGEAGDGRRSQIRTGGHGGAAGGGANGDGEVRDRAGAAAAEQIEVGARERAGLRGGEGLSCPVGGVESEAAVGDGPVLLVDEVGAG